MGVEEVVDGRLLLHAAGPSSQLSDPYPRLCHLWRGFAL